MSNRRFQRSEMTFTNQKVGNLEGNRDDRRVINYGTIQIIDLDRKMPLANLSITKGDSKRAFRKAINLVVDLLNLWNAADNKDDAELRYEVWCSINAAIEPFGLEIGNLPVSDGRWAELKFRPTSAVAEAR